MSKTLPPHLPRRDFLRRTGAATLATLASPWGMDLTGLAEAAAATTSPADDYKALICIFLQGGNDHGNTLIPVDADAHGVYTRVRGGLAVPSSALAGSRLHPLNGADLGGRELALNPAWADLVPMFDTDHRLAVLLNVGPLHRPTTLADFRAGVALPPKLFSHNDQQSVWQSHGAEGSTVGWGGLIGDDALVRNASSSLSCVNLSGNAVFMAGQQAGQFMVNRSGPEPLKALEAGNMFGSQACVDAFRKLVTTQEPSVHRLAKEHSLIMQRAIETNSQLLQRLAGVSQPVPRGATANPLADQLNTAVRIMAAHRDLGSAGLRRQVFFVQLGGFDHHDNLSTLHPKLLKQVADALVQLDADLFQLGLRDQVTAFTASDFGRTLSSNGDGSDHGWGSHHVVWGGAVRGGRVYGNWPDVTDVDTGAHNIGQGRLLPTMSVDHLALALAGWMGVTDPALLARIAPHAAAFSGVSPLAGLF